MGDVLLALAVLIAVAGLSRVLRRRRGSEEIEDQGDNPYSEDDDFSFREPEQNARPGFRQREEDRDTLDEIRRERGED